MSGLQLGRMFDVAIGAGVAVVILALATGRYLSAALMVAACLVFWKGRP